MSSNEIKSAEPKVVIDERIYIGNVDYKATKEELKKLFETNNLKVKDVEIPSKEYKRNSNNVYVKHLGFAFAQFDTKEEANEAIEKLDGQKFKRRVVFVKKAIPPPTEEEKKKRLKVFKAKMESIVKEKKTPTVTNDYKSDSLKSSSQDYDDSKKKLANGKSSEDTIFVTNLDYNVSLKTLNNLFKNLNPKWIHLPLKKSFPSKNLTTRKQPTNKGFAFVKFNDEETQKAAVEQFNGKELDGRNIVVDIAINTRALKDFEKDDKEKKSVE